MRKITPSDIMSFIEDSCSKNDDCPFSPEDYPHSCPNDSFCITAIKKGLNLAAFNPGEKQELVEDNE